MPGVVDAVADHPDDVAVLQLAHRRELLSSGMTRRATINPQFVGDNLRDSFRWSPVSMTIRRIPLARSHISTCCLHALVAQLIRPTSVPSTASSKGVSAWRRSLSTHLTPS